MLSHLNVVGVAVLADLEAILVDIHVERHHGFALGQALQGCAKQGEES
jgi:hypothetical protein